MSKSDGDVSTNVGTEVLFENDNIRIWSMTLEPGESSPYHRHLHDYFYIYTTPSHITAHYPDDSEIARGYQEGFVNYSVVGDGIEHHITNTGDERHNQIIIELKGASASQTPLTPENNGRFA